MQTIGSTTLANLWDWSMLSFSTDCAKFYDLVVWLMDSCFDIWYLRYNRPVFSYKNSVNSNEWYCGNTSDYEIIKATPISITKKIAIAIDMFSD